MKPRALYRSIAGCADRFRRLLPSARTVQRRRLRSILAANARCEYGLRHGFGGIAGAADFRAQVPVARYDDLARDIARMAAGEPDVLVTGPLLAFEETGGTSAGPKLIPYNEAQLAAFRRALLAWLDDLASAHPAVAAGSAYWAISPAARAPRTTRAGLPVGLGSDAAYFGADLAPLVLQTLAVPPAAGASGDLPGWRAATCAHLAACRDLALVSVWSPTFLLELAAHVELDPAVISCWDQASARPYAQELRRRFPRARVQGKGLLATEGVVSIPLEGLAWPVLAVDSAYFEFLDEAGRAHEASELALGAEYEVLMTTEGGLYRYAIGDRVRVRGHAGEAPLLEFTGRAAVVDLCGEKLSEAFVNGALAPLGLKFALLAPGAGGRAGYSLIVDAAEVRAEHAADVAQRADRALAANPQYALARGLGQLAPLELARRERPLEAWVGERLRRGQRLGDIKPPSLAHEPF
jgi:hypothetical protein